MKAVRSIVLTAAALVASASTQAADSPAQIGYCMQYLRNAMTDVESATIVPDPKLDARLRSIFDRWRMKAQSLDMTQSQISSEVARGGGQADSDMATVKARITAQTDECVKAQSAAPSGVDAMTPCLAEKHEANVSDPMIAGVHERVAPCMKGPSL